MPVPAAAGSGMYTLHAGDPGGLLLSWIEPGSSGHVLAYARLTADGWTRQPDIAAGDDWFVNWADRPSIAATPGGGLLAHWLVRGSGDGKYGYGIRVARREADGRWVTATDIGLDSGDDYSGFLSFVALPDGIGAIYLAPPTADAPSPTAVAAAPAAAAHAEHIKTLRWAEFDRAGRRVADRLLDDDVCSCCSPSVVVAGDTIIVAYRDRRAGEIRDISVMRRTDGQWSAPASPNRDGWMIAGCPTNGPALAVSGPTTATAWFTAADDQPRLRLAFSSDFGATFAPSVMVDDDQPIGWPGLVLLDDRTAIVSWLAHGEQGVGELMLRRVTVDGRAGPALRVATSEAGRATGVPQLARVGDDLVVVWRDGQVRSLRLPAARVF